MPRFALHARLLALGLVGAVVSCHSAPLGPPGPVARHSSSIAVSHDGKTLYVVNPDADSVSIIDVAGRKLVQEILLAPKAPAVDSNGKFTPAVEPRALALSPRDKLLYVTGERSGTLYAIDLTTDKMSYSVAVGAEPTGVLVAPDESAVFVACSNEGTVVRVDPTERKVTATAEIDDGKSSGGYTIPAKPWALAWSNDGASLYVSHFLAPTVSTLDPATLHAKGTLSIPDVASRGDKLLANGQGRALYDIAPRPGSSGELWVAHMMLATTTPQPDLDFESTAFPTLSVLKGDGTFVTRMSTNAMSISANNGQFGDVTSGPHAVEFTPDGKWALVADSASEDILAVDADGRVEASLFRSNPPTGHMLEGLVVSPDGKVAYVDQRNTGDVAVFDIDTSNGTIALTVDGSPIPRMTKDPMPADLRHGQFLFNTANSDLVKITKNHWVSCATCHPEGRSDAVTWRFKEGPRDTPSNAGGIADTGFLFRTADRATIFDYWHTVDDEQGGSFFGTTPTDPPTDPAIVGDLKDLESYINHALPPPVAPHTDPKLVARGKQLFEDSHVGCSGCHSGPAYTDSGGGNPNLDLKGTVLLHDVGTCATTGFPDVDHPDVLGDMRKACSFDTPTLRGISDSAPYLHDGSAATLRDVLDITRGKMGDVSSLSSSDLDALVEYLRSL